MQTITSDHIMRSDVVISHAVNYALVQKAVVHHA